MATASVFMCTCTCMCNACTLYYTQLCSSCAHTWRGQKCHQATQLDLLEWAPEGRRRHLKVHYACLYVVYTYVHVTCVCIFVCICMSCALIYLWVGGLLQVFSKLPPVCQLVVHPVEPSLVDIDLYPSPILGPGHTLWGRHGIVYHAMLKPITEVDSIELCIYPN